MTLLSSDCSSVILCSWCEYDNSGLALSNPYCSTTDVCPGGYLTSGGDSPTTTSEDGGDGGDNAGGGMGYGIFIFFKWLWNHAYTIINCDIHRQRKFLIISL